MASYQQEKKAKSATITDDVIPEPKRLGPAKKARRGLLGMNSGNSSPSLSAVGTPMPGLSVTSAPNDQNLRRQAMKIPIVHLLAMKPTSTEDIIRTTHIPKSDLEAVVGKIAQQIDGKWKLLDRAYKDLNVWDFGYRTQEDRQMAIDNAIRAYDRTRVGKEENIWQLLLPKEERGKGKVLSKLHLSSGSQTNRGSTPSHMPSPLGDASEDEKPISSTNTPRIGSSGTPKPTVAKSAGSDMMKRLLAKDPKKARAAEEAKEKRKREREAAASDREGRPAKKQKPATSTTKSTNASGTGAKASSKIKSAELVHSSDDDEEEGEVKDSPPVAPARPGKLVAPSTVRPKALATRSPESGDNHVKPTKLATKATVTSKPKTSTPSIKPTASPAVKPAKTAAPGGSTPSSSALSAPQRQRTQLSPSKSHSRPTVPSPLGAARPRNASDVSDRSAVGVQRTKQGGASTPKGLGITTTANGVRKKRQDTVTSHESFTSSEGDKKLPPSKAPSRAPGTNSVSSQRSLVANSAKPTANNKRKADEPLSRGHTGQDPKHRKADSVSTASQRSHSSSFGTIRTMATTNGTSPDAVFDSGSSDSSGSVTDTITYEQGIEKAKNFREKYYPQYIKLYDSISDRQAKGETIRQDEREKLWKMHRRLEELKREIGVAAKRGEA